MVRWPSMAQRWLVCQATAAAAIDPWPAPTYTERGGGRTERSDGRADAGGCAGLKTRGKGHPMPTKEEVFGRVREIITENLGVAPEKVMLETRFREDLEADSLDLAELIMDFEDKFEVGDISEDDATKIESVGDAVEYIFAELSK